MFLYRPSIRRITLGISSDLEDEAGAGDIGFSIGGGSGSGVGGGGGDARGGTTEMGPTFVSGILTTYIGLEGGAGVGFNARKGKESGLRGVSARLRGMLAGSGGKSEGVNGRASGCHVDFAGAMGRYGLGVLPVPKAEGMVVAVLPKPPVFMPKAPVVPPPKDPVVLPVPAGFASKMRPVSLVFVPKAHCWGCGPPNSLVVLNAKVLFW